MDIKINGFEKDYYWQYGLKQVASCLKYLIKIVDSILKYTYQMRSI